MPVIEQKDWRERLRDNIAAAASEISRNAADTILTGGRRILDAEITVLVSLDEPPRVKYRVDVLPEDHGQQSPVF